MRRLVILSWMVLLVTAVFAQQFKWPPRSFPLSVPCKVTAEVDYYWNVQHITCIGKVSGGYKFRILGIAKHDYERSQSIDIYYITPGNRLVVAGSYFFPGIRKGQKFSFNITSAFSGYVPAGFKGFFIHDKWLTIPEETPTAQDILKSVDMKKAYADSKSEVDADMAAIQKIEAEEAEAAAKAAEAATEPVTVAEQMPVFPGGESGLMSFLSRNVKYPLIAQENEVQGCVVIQIVVDTDGSVTNAEVAKAVDPYLDKEALRVVKSMPKWTPGKVGGKAVKVKFTFPVNFRLTP